MLITGAGTAEELGESEMERFEALAGHPVCINLASGPRMRSCGLFSEYQIASLQDYLSRTGDILSITELGTVPGFTPELAQALAYFVSFESHSPAGKRSTARIRHDATARTVIKETGTTLAGKYHLSYGERAEVFLSRRESTTASAVIYGRRPWKVVLGDYNARLGQGLLVWSGFSLSGFSSALAFARNASGFSGTGSFTPFKRGMALEWSGCRFGASGSLSADGLALGSASWHGRSAQAGINAFSQRGQNGISADWKAGFGHLTLLGELAWADGPAALAGALWTPAYKTVASLNIRYYSPSYSSINAGAVRSGTKVRDEAGIAAGLAWKWLETTADMAIHPQRLAQRKNNYQQFKFLLNAKPEFSWHRWTLSPALRWTERMQVSPSGEAYSIVWRHDIRADLKACKGPLQGCLRLNAVQTGSSRAGALAYLELGYKTTSDSAPFQASVFLRGTICDIPDWASRIYSYERDLPGCFTVPAYYGKKHSFTLAAGADYKLKKTRHQLYLRASLKDLKIQYRLRL